MSRLISSLKSITLVATSLVIFSLPLSNAYAKAGCCSGHKGVKKCDNQTGLYICKDGTSGGSNCSCKKKTSSGCCSGHDGVAVGKCDPSSRYQNCKDGSTSSCPCPKTK